MIRLVLRLDAGVRREVSALHVAKLGTDQQNKAEEKTGRESSDVSKIVDMWEDSDC